MDEESKRKKEEKKKRRKEKRKETRAEFKKFIFRGNIVDLAVAVAVGSAFTAIVNSFVKDIIGGLMGFFIGDMNLEDLEVKLGEGASIRYGAFLQSIIYFLIVATTMFIVIRIIARVKAMLEKLEKKEVEEVKEVKKEVKVDSDEVVLLREIRDLLKDNKSE